MSLSSSISSSVKESSSVSSSKMSSSSISSSSVSSKMSSSLASAVSDISSEMDDLLATATGSRSSLANRAGCALRSIDDDLDSMLSGTSISSSGKNATSSSSVSSSSTKQVSKMSSISQSSMESVEGTGIDSHSKSSVKQSSTSMASSANLASETKIVDGQVVHAQTLAEKASVAGQSQKEKVVEDGQVLVDTGSRSETSSAGRFMATKEMSQKELDSFFQDTPAIAGKPVEALNYDKDRNSFEITLSDLPEFSPQELTVKIVRDVITVYGTHEEVIGNNFKMHTYVRRFTVPKGLNNNVEWKLNADGALAITAGDTVKGGVSQVHLDCTIFKPRSFFKSVQN